jgi:hypothetical protein
MFKLLSRALAFAFAISALRCALVAQTFTPIPKSATQVYISANGLSVAGNQSTDFQGTVGWLWRTDTEAFWPYQVSNTYTLSGDGLTAGGDTNSNNLTFYYPFSGTPTQPGIVPECLSADGTILFGFENAGSPADIWTVAKGRAAIYQTTKQEYPWACSADGSRVYGYEISTGATQAWTWTQAAGAKSIGSFRVWNCSLDGTTAVGVDSTTKANNVVDVWNASTGFSQITLPGGVYAEADMPVSITADGSTIWGSYLDSFSKPHAYYYTSKTLVDLGQNTTFINEKGMRGSDRLPGYWLDTKGATHYGYYEFNSTSWVDVQSYLTANGQNLTGWSNLKVEAISDDGDEMAGYATGPSGTECFYVTVPAVLPPFTAFSATPTSLVGGMPAVGYVRLGIKAPPGIAVSLLSGKSIVQVPSSVVVPAGSTSATFNIRTSPVIAETTVVLLAELGSKVRSTTLIINPALIQAFYFVPSPVIGGSNAEGVVRILAAAPAGGTAITLSSGNSVVSVLPTVTVQAGKTIATFTATTQPVVKSTTVILTATDGTYKTTGSLVVAPPDFQNPGFEVPAIGAGAAASPPPTGFVWTTNAQSGVANGSGAWGTGAHQGSQYAFLHASSVVPHGLVQQALTGLTIGNKYEVTFYMARRNGNAGNNSGAAVTVTANGSTIFAAATPGSSSWVSYSSAVFTASTTSYTFVFQSAQPTVGADTGSLLDDVHLVAVP